MRVSISGTHCTGKSTIIDSLRKDEFFLNNNFVIVDGPTRQLKDQGLPINNNEAKNYDHTQLMCSYIDGKNLTTWQGNSISDRCLLDTYIYTKYLYSKELVSRPVFLAIESFWVNCRDKYDLFFFPSKYDIQLIGDKYRNTDVAFREQIYQLFEYERIEARLPYYVLSGTNAERIEQLKIQLLINQNR